MTQEAKERKDFLILGAAKGDRKSGKKELMRLGMYWVRPGGFFFITVSRSPRAVSSSLSSCKRNNSRDYHKKKSTGKKSGCYISFLITETNRWLLHRFASIKVIWVMVLQRLNTHIQNCKFPSVSIFQWREIGSARNWASGIYCYLWLNKKDGNAPNSDI